VILPPQELKSAFPGLFHDSGYVKRRYEAAYSNSDVFDGIDFL